MDKFKNEIWKEISFEVEDEHPKYEISSHGRVKSYAIDKENGRIMRGSNINGYLAIMVRFTNSKTRSYYIHRLVAETFIRRPSSEHNYVIHVDYDKQNNHRSNLAWVTEKELVDHNNQNPAVLKKRSTGYKLTESDVKVIKRLLRSNKTRLSMIAKRFKITHTQLNRIRSGENWGNVQ